MSGLGPTGGFSGSFAGGGAAGSTHSSSATPTGSALEKVAAVVGKLNAALSALGDGNTRLQPPVVISIGLQSSGKSSVIEAFTGRDFLPRGHTLATRCPIELTLVNTPRSPSADTPEEWAEFSHTRTRFHDWGQVRAEILRQMDKLAGSNKGIVDEPIGLWIYSPRVPDLSIIDLPGLVKTPQGDQPADIGEGERQRGWDGRGGGDREIGGGRERGEREGRRQRGGGRERSIGRELLLLLQWCCGAVSLRKEGRRIALKGSAPCS